MNLYPFGIFQGVLKKIELSASLNVNTWKHLCTYLFEKFLEISYALIAKDKIE